MASTLQLKRRIKTAQNISKTTRALNMIATSKLKRAQDAVLASRPYVEKLQIVVSEISANVEIGEQPKYMKKNSGKKELLIVISPDKGLCGGMISNLARAYFRHIKTGDNVIISVGKKIESSVARSKLEVSGSFPFGNIIPSFNAVYPVVKLIDEQFLSDKVSQVSILTTRFKNVFNQEPVITPLLPIKIEKPDITTAHAIQLFEPSAPEVLPGLLRRYIEVTIYQQMLESYASFQAAQMTAMKNATDNAKEIIEELKLVYNKTRQEKITSELLDISGSAFTM